MNGAKLDLRLNRLARFCMAYGGQIANCATQKYLRHTDHPTAVATAPLSPRPYPRRKTAAVT